MTERRNDHREARWKDSHILLILFCYSLTLQRKHDGVVIELFKNREKR